jgi:hypothetical protein
MDSYNDKEIAKNADFTFLPRNSSAELIRYLHVNQKLVFPIGKFPVMRHQCYTSEHSYAAGVVDGMRRFLSYLS